MQLSAPPIAPVGRVMGRRWGGLMVRTIGGIFIQSVTTEEGEVVVEVEEIEDEVEEAEEAEEEEVEED